MKNILILSDYYEPAYLGGGPIVSLNNIANRFSGLDVCFFVICRSNDHISSSPLANIDFNRWLIRPSGARVFYSTSFFFQILAMVLILKRKKIDLIYINSFFSFRFSILPLFILRILNLGKGKVLLAPRGELSQGALCFSKFRKRFYLACFSPLFRSLIKSFHVTSDAELASVTSVFPSKYDFRFVPNFVSTEFIASKSDVLLKRTASALKIVYIGRISSKKNLGFLLKFIDMIDVPFSLEIFGPIESDASFNNFFDFLKSTSNGHFVSYCGELDRASVRIKLLNSDLFFLPTLNENFGHSIWEALACGCPVLISNNTPWLNLREKNIGYDIDLSSPHLFAKAINDLYHLSIEDFHNVSLSCIEYASSFCGSDNQSITEQFSLLFGER